MNCSIYSLLDSRIYPIHSIGYSDDTSVTRYGPAKRNNYIIHYVLSGKGYFNSETVEKGHGFLIAPGDQECYFADENDPWDFIWIIFENNADLAEVFKSYNADAGTKIFQYDNISALTATKDTIISKASTTMHASELYEFFLHIFNEHNVGAKTKKATENVYLRYAVKFINANLFRKLTVNELVELLGISQPYLYNIFKSSMNISPKQYIDKQKLEKAKELLLTTNMSITEVANSLGIDESVTFSKFFKRNTGMSPSEFAEKK